MSLKPKLSVICPTLNEAGSIALLLADINLWEKDIDINVIDGGSKDLTIFLANIGGAKVITTNESNRGSQLKKGASYSSADWLLFLHADCRLPNLWARKIEELITNPLSNKYGWYFDFKVVNKHPQFRLLELAVFLRSIFLQQPYGDQGLLISRKLYQEIGGYTDLHIMEDFDFVRRLSKKTKLKRIKLPLITDYRKWEKINVIWQGIKNARYRYRWLKGESSKNLLNDYYK